MKNRLLVEKCIKKDLSAWEEFTHTFSGLIRRSVMYKIRTTGAFLPYDEVEDIAQDTLLSIWEKNKLSKVRDIKSLEAWLVMVSINTASNYLKKHAINRSQDISLSDVSFEKDNNKKTVLDNIIRSKEFPAIEKASFNELCALLNKTISGLKTKHQLIAKMNLYDGEKQKDIAKIMNLPLSTVGTVLSRVKKELKRKLKKNKFF